MGSLGNQESQGNQVRQESHRERMEYTGSLETQDFQESQGKTASTMELLVTRRMENLGKRGFHRGLREKQENMAHRVCKGSTCQLQWALVWEMA